MFYWSFCIKAIKSNQKINMQSLLLLDQNELLCVGIKIDNISKFNQYNFQNQVFTKEKSR
jgi:hypothetical protein